MGKHTDIEKALMQGMLDANIGLPMSVENSPFDKPADGAPWAAYWFVPAEGSSSVRAITLGDAGEDQHTGIVQLDINYPLRQGVNPARAKLDEIVPYFPIGKKVTFGMASVTISSCSRSRGREVEGWYRVSMTLSWYARVPRNP